MPHSYYTDFSRGIRCQIHEVLCRRKEILRLTLKRMLHFHVVQLPRISRLQNVLTAQCFLLIYGLSGFQSRIGSCYVWTHSNQLS